MVRHTIAYELRIYYLSMVETRDHVGIRKGLIEASYSAIEHLQSILSEPILTTKEIEGGEDIGPEKFLNALKAKKQAQTDAFEMLKRIEDEQKYLDSLNITVSERQEEVKESNKGIAETQANRT